MSFRIPSTPIDKNDRLQTASILTPTGVKRSDVWIPTDYSDVILCHILKNYIPDLTPPLILAIQGQPGEGKSFQARELCLQIGVYLVILSGAALAGPFEKDAEEVLRKAYIYASAVEKEVGMTAILIDDFDLSVASTFDERRYTVNSQLLTGFLMNLADNPTRCGTEQTSRIPIIITGNNFSALHKPLVRHGRMQFFEWMPSLEQKEQMVGAAFSSIISQHDIKKLGKLISDFSDKPLSFFIALKDDIVDDAIKEVIKKENSIDMALVRKKVDKALQGRYLTLASLHDFAERKSKTNVKDYTDVDGKKT